MTQPSTSQAAGPVPRSATEVRVKRRERRPLVGWACVPARDTVKLRGPPKASTTAARRKAQRSTRVMTSGMVTA
jgi:hypothetical protein